MRSIKTKIRGVTQVNEDGKSRQDIIWEQVNPNDYLGLEREPDNPYDPNAIAVLVVGDQNEKIGYLSKDLAAKIAPLMDAQHRVLCQVLDVTGGEEEGESIGVNVELEIYSQEEIAEINRKMKARAASKPEKPTEAKPAQEPQKPAKAKKRVPLWAVIVGGLALTVCCFAAYLSGDQSDAAPLPTKAPASTATSTATSEPTETPEPTATKDPNSLTLEEAYEFQGLAIDFVKSRLKAPSTAKFADGILDIGEWKFGKNGNVITALSWVDAENSFGATLREDFGVQIDYETHELLYLVLGDEVLYGEMQ